MAQTEPLTMTEPPTTMTEPLKMVQPDDPGLSLIENTFADIQIRPHDGDDFPMSTATVSSLPSSTQPNQSSELYSKKDLLSGLAQSTENNHKRFFQDVYESHDHHKKYLPPNVPPEAPNTSAVTTVSDAPMDIPLEEYQEVPQEVAQEVPLQVPNGHKESTVSDGDYVSRSPTSRSVFTEVEKNRDQNSSIDKCEDSSLLGSTLEKLKFQSALPHDIRSLSGTIRNAVEKFKRCEPIDPYSRKDGRVNRSDMGEHKCDEPDVDLGVPSSDVEVELSDQLREFIENTLERPELLAHSEKSISINTLLTEIREFNKFRTNPVNPISIIQQCPIVKRKTAVAEVYLESLPHCAQLRLRSSERNYQRLLGSNPGLKKIGFHNVDEQTKDCLSIELKGTVAMSTSLIIGPFLGFVAGYAISELLGVENVTTRAIAGLCTCIFCFAVEVSLIMVRYAKLAKIRQHQQKRKLRKLELARREKLRNLNPT